MKQLRHGIELSKQRSQQEIRRIARRTARVLGAIILSLVALLFVLGYYRGSALWPAWLLQNRTLLIGALGLILMWLILAAPLIIKANSDPQPFAYLRDRWWCQEAVEKPCLRSESTTAPRSGSWRAG